jgi:hypothetical protein
MLGPKFRGHGLRGLALAAFGLLEAFRYGSTDVGELPISVVFERLGLLGPFFLLSKEPILVLLYAQAFGLGLAQQAFLKLVRNRDWHGDWSSSTSI